MTPTADLTSTNVQAALEELQSDINSLSVTGNAIDISFTPTGSTTSNNVQAAIVEIQTQVDGIIIPISYNASDIVVAPTGSGLTSTNAQDAFIELQNQIDILTAGGADGNGIYDGNGILPSNVTVDAATHNFVVDDLGQVNFILSDLSSLTFSNPGSLAVTLNGVAGFSFSDNRGIIYNGDYSSNYISRSLVDKGYVDGQISALTIPTTASELPFVATGNTTSTNVQAALEELQTEIDNFSGADGNGIYSGNGLIAADTTITVDTSADLNIDLGNSSNFNVSSSSNSVEFIVSGNINAIEFGSGSNTAYFSGEGFHYTPGTISNLQGGGYSDTSLVHKAYIDAINLENTTGGTHVFTNSLGNTVSFDVSNNIYQKNGLISGSRIVTQYNSLDFNLNPVSGTPTFTVSNTTGGPLFRVTSSAGAGGAIIMQNDTNTARLSGTGGITYDADYTAEYTDLSLVHKGYVDTQVAGVNPSVVAADVAVTPSGNLTSTNVQFALTELQGDINFIVTNPSFLRNVYENDDTLTSNRTIDADSHSLSVTNLPVAGFSLSSGTKSTTFSGVNGWAYAADYSVDYTDRSLVDKRYVDNNRYTDSDTEAYISDNVVYSNIHTLTSSAGTVT